MNKDPYFLENVKSCQAVIQNADGTALKTVLTPGAEGSRLKSLSACSDDTSDRLLQLWVTVGGVDYLLGTISVPDLSGTDATNKAVAALNGVDSPWVQSDGVNYFLDLPSGAVLKAKTTTTVTSGKTIYLFGEYGDF